MLSESDVTFIDNLSMRVITTFRNDVWSPCRGILLVLNILTVDQFQTFPKDFIDRHPQIFLDFEWINVSKLKIFIESELNMYFRLWYGKRKLNASNRSMIQSRGAKNIPVK